MTQTHTAEAGDVTTLRESVIDALELLETMREHEGPWEADSFGAATIDKLRAALTASPAPRAPAAVPEELREAFENAVTFLETDEEWDAPGTDLFTWRKGIAEPLMAGLRTLAAAPVAPPAYITVERIGKDRKGASVTFAVSECNSEAHRYEEPLPGLVVALDVDGSILRVEIEDLSANMVPAPPADGGTEGLREALEQIIALAPDTDPGSPFLELGGYRSQGNAGDLIEDGRQHALWEAAYIARAALSSRTPAGAAGDPVGSLKNPFRHDMMRKAYDEAVRAYTASSRTLFYEGKAYRGNAIAGPFWNGFEGINADRWDAPSRKTLAYAYWCAGRDIATRLASPASAASVLKLKPARFAVAMP